MKLNRLYQAALRVSFIAVFALQTGAQVAAAGPDDRPITAITNHYAARNFIPGALNKDQLNQILTAGMKAPSASNQQPWHFTVVQNQNLARQIVRDNLDGNVLIVISAEGDGKTNGRMILDCGLATESIYLAAQALGLGSRIYTGPIDTINSRLKAVLGLPSGYSAIAVVRVGQVQPGIDAVSAASSRKSLDSMVNYK
jgi:nitroreductase